MSTTRSGARRAARGFEGIGNNGADRDTSGRWNVRLPAFGLLLRPLLWAITGSDRESAQELVEARRLLEVELAGFAAQRATADDLRDIEKHLEALQVASNTESRLNSDLSFHLAIGEASHNSILLNALLLIRNLMRQWIETALEQADVAPEVLKQHKDIYAAIRKRDANGARAAMQSHLQAMAAYLMQTPQTTAESARLPGD